MHRGLYLSLYQHLIACNHFFTWRKKQGYISWFNMYTYNLLYIYKVKGESKVSFPPIRYQSHVSIIDRYSEGSSGGM